MSFEDPKGPQDKGRRKPVRLDVEIGLLSAEAPAVPPPETGRRASGVARKSGSSGASAQGPAPGFDARMRFEKKGRGGQPVIVLYAVQKEALSRVSCKDVDELGRKLRSMLGCGGTVADGAVVLQVRDRTRLEDVLARLGIKAQPSGGF